MQKGKEKLWVLLFNGRNTAAYFEIKSITNILPDVLNKIKDKSTTQNIFRIQSDDSIICRFYCIAFLKYAITEETLLDYTFLFFSNVN